MVKIFDADLIKGHFIVNDNGKRALVDTGCPYIINDENKYSKPHGELYLNDARSNVDPTISEFRGLEYFAQHKVLFDYKKAAIIVADQGDDVAPVHPVAEFAISGLPERIFINLAIARLTNFFEFSSTTRSFTAFAIPMISSIRTFLFCY